MKRLTVILVIFTVGFMGYKAEPSMRYALTGLSPKAPQSKPGTSPAPQAAAPAVAAPAPAQVTPPPVIDPTQLTSAQLPQQVTLKVATEVADASGLKLKVDAGSRLKLVRIEGDQVVVSPGTSPFEGRVSISGTDLMEQLAANPPVQATGGAATEPSAPSAQPAALPSGDTAAPAVPAVPTPAPPAEAPQPVATPAVPAAGNTTDAVEVMKEHIRSGGIKEFTAEQVQGWKAEADEVIDGSTYQTGMVRYNADTIFGTKTIEAKAIIQNGKVVRWIWPKSGLEIK
jgi:hypothetical protein